MAAVAMALILGPSDGAHSGADWEGEERVHSGTDWEEIRRAAEGGDAEAQIKLGNAYLEDDDVLGGTGALEQDDVQAYLWLSLGVAGLSNADTDTLMVARDFAIEDLRRLEKRMTPLQLKKAQRFIQERRGGARQTGQASMIREAQQLLRKLGYAPGPVDGKWGPRTERAFRSYLREAGLADVAFSAQALEWIREAAGSAAAGTVRAGQPATGQARASQAGDDGTIEEIVYDYGARYRGQTRGGKPHGRGVKTWANGDRYEGDFVDGKRTGHGVAVWADGSRYEGEFVENKRTGRGVFTWPNGNRYEGDFVDSKRHGKGTFTWTNGNRYEGEFRGGKQHGPGISIKADGRRFAVNFKDGKQVSSSTTSTAQTAGAGSSGSGSTSSGAGSGTTSTAAGGSGGGAGNALDCVRVEDISARYEYPRFLIVNICHRRIVVHVCTSRETSRPKCSLDRGQWACGGGRPPRSLLSEDHVPPSSWNDRFYSAFMGLGPDTAQTWRCSEEFRYAACFYNADGGRTWEGRSYIPSYPYFRNFAIDDTRYVFESDKTGNFSCRWGEQVSDEARGRKQR